MRVPDVFWYLLGLIEASLLYTDGIISDGHITPDDAAKRVTRVYLASSAQMFIFVS